MFSLLRRAVRSKTARTVSAGVLGLSLGVPAAAASPTFAAEGSCAGSTVTRDYTADAMTFRLRLDLDGCHWWNGSARNLVIWLSRDDGTGPASRYQMEPCEAGPDPDTRTTNCEIFTTLAHPAEEKAVSYQGEATWEWKDGTRRVSFDTHCSTAQRTARCDDPVATWRQHD